MSDQPPAKRQRTSTSSREDRSTLDASSSNANSGPSSLFQRGKPWLEDGNVILVAGSTGFRVFRSILSECSEVFSDMFMVPQPADAEIFEGCPIVHLPDSKKDVGLVLSVLFGGGRM